MKNHLLQICILLIVICLSTIIVAQELTFLVVRDYAPFSYEENGVLKGLTVDIIKELSEKTGTDITLVPESFDNAFEKLKGEGNYAIPTLVFTKERKPMFSWVGPLAITNTYLYGRKNLDKDILTLDDAKNVNSIGVVKDYYSHQLLESHGFDNLVVYSNEEFLLHALSNGNIDLAPFNTAVLQRLLQINNEVAEFSKTISIDLDMTFIGFSSDVPNEIVKNWQNELDKMKETGEFREIYSKWLPNQKVPGIYTFLTEEYPPVTYMENDGKISGFVTDIVKEILRRNEMKENIFLVPWNIAYSLALNLPNIVLFSIDRTPQRENLFNWIGPVGKNTAYFYSLKDKDIHLNTVDDAKEVNSIATIEDWWTEQLLKDLGFENLRSFKNPVNAVINLVTGRSEMSIFTDLTVENLVKDAGYSMDELQRLLEVQTNYFYIAASKGTNEELILKFQETLNVMKRNGSFERIVREYVPNMLITPLLMESTSIDISDLNYSQNILKIDELAKISLEQNASTGYVWDMKITNPNVVSLVYMKSEEETPGDDLKIKPVGTPSKIEWVFKAKNTGETSIIFSLRRPWESVHPLKVISINIQVK
ncbi:MAG: transporter substrate-binding domain-containing protein [Elusimicrobiota bacterium]